VVQSRSKGAEGSFQFTAVKKVKSRTGLCRGKFQANKEEWVLVFRIFQKTNKYIPKVMFKVESETMTCTCAVLAIKRYKFKNGSKIGGTQRRN
jgi:hypothetical protein